MPILHMETDLVRSVGNQLQQASGLLEQQVQQFSQSLHTLGSAWQGSSADIFHGEAQTLLQWLTRLSDAGSILNQRLQREVEEWEQRDSQFGKSTVVSISYETGATQNQVPTPVLETILNAEEQWQKGLNLPRKAGESLQDLIARIGPAIASDDGSIGRYNIEPRVAKGALEWAFKEGIAEEYDFTEMPSDDEIVRLIMDEQRDDDLVALRLNELKDMHPELREMSWDQINNNSDYVAKLYSGYIGAGGDWDLWKSDLTPGPEAVKRLELIDTDTSGGGGGGGAW